MLQAMGLKHDGHLQRQTLPMGQFGHTMLLAPGDMSLRGTILNREARLEAGLSDGCEGRYAGSLWCTPIFSHLWPHYGERVHPSALHRHVGASFLQQPRPQGQQIGRFIAERRDLFASLSCLDDDQTDAPVSADAHQCLHTVDT